MLRSHLEMSLYLKYSEEYIWNILKKCEFALDSAVERVAGSSFDSHRSL